YPVRQNRSELPRSRPGRVRLVLAELGTPPSSTVAQPTSATPSVGDGRNRWWPNLHAPGTPWRSIRKPMPKGAAAVNRIANTPRIHARTRGTCDGGLGPRRGRTAARPRARRPASDVTSVELTFE